MLELLVLPGDASGTSSSPLLPIFVCLGIQECGWLLDDQCAPINLLGFKLEGCKEATKNLAADGDAVCGGHGLSHRSYI